MAYECERELLALPPRNWLDEGDEEEEIDEDESDSLLWLRQEAARFAPYLERWQMLLQLVL